MTTIKHTQLKSSFRFKVENDLSALIDSRNRRGMTDQQFFSKFKHYICGYIEFSHLYKGAADHIELGLIQALKNKGYKIEKPQ